MNIKLIAFNCALLAMCLSYLPMSNAVACTTPGEPAGCTDCTDTANAALPDCLATVETTVAAVETTVPTVTDTTTAAATTDTTTAATTTDTTTAASCGGSGGKKRVKRKWKVVRKPGKKVIKRHRNGKKSIFGKSGSSVRTGKRGNKRGGRGGRRGGKGGKGSKRSRRSG